MEGKDFEKWIKEGLESREIKPSKDLWSGLEAQLDGTQKKNWKKFLPLAAVLILGLFVAGLQFFWGAEEESSSAGVAVEETIPSHKIEKPTILEPVVEEIEPEERFEKIASDDSPKSKSDKKLVADNNTTKQSQEPFIEEDREIVSIAKSDESQQNANAIPGNDEIDQLLGAAMNRLEERDESAAIAGVNASDLLNEVSDELETEADKDFRQKAEDFLKTKWQQTKTFLAHNKSN